MEKLSKTFLITLELDCAPGLPRPDTYMKHICDEILKIDYPKPFSTFFGNWTWFVRVTKEQQADIGEYITSLYNNGHIRYGSWNETTDADITSVPKVPRFD